MLYSHTCHVDGIRRMCLSQIHFPARVYAILSVQLAVTAGSCFAFGLNPGLGMALRQGDRAVAAIPGISVLLSTIAWVWICASPNARRRAPIKWKLLTLFTVGEAIAVGFLSSFYNFRTVLSAMSATAVSSLTVSAYTILNSNPKRDLSQWGAGLAS